MSYTYKRCREEDEDDLIAYLEKSGIEPCAGCVYKVKDWCTLNDHPLMLDECSEWTRMEEVSQ